jgi:hypothetical protein
MFVEEPFAGADGRYVRMPPRNVVPKPRQKPHPPLWVACSRRSTIRMAARRGIGALSFSFVEPEEAGTWVREYEEIIASERCVPAGFAVNPRVAVTVPMHVHADEATAIERGIDGAHFFGYALAHYYVFGDHRPGRTDVWREFQERREDVGFARGSIEAAGDALGIRVLEQGLGSLRGAIGTPEQVRDLLRRYEAAGVDQVMFVMQAGRTRHEHIVEALELFGREVAPEFAARADAADAAREERLGDAIRQALARRPPPRTLDDVAPVAPLASGPAGRRTPADLVAGAVRRVPDRAIERTVGSDVALRVLFEGMAKRFRPDRADGFSGELQYVLTMSDGSAKPWTVTVNGTKARVRRGPAADPALTVTLALTDIVRVAAGELDLGAALFDGRLGLEGDLDLANRLGPMFGAASPL